MNKDTFESLFVWQLAKELFCKIYVLTENRKDYYLKDQILRAALSISNNIAEGYERETSKELVRFFYIARGSAGEVRSMLLICQTLGKIEEVLCKKLIDDINKLSSGIYRFIKSRSTQEQ